MFKVGCEHMSKFSTELKKVFKSSIFNKLISILSGSLSDKFSINKPLLKIRV